MPARIILAAVLGTFAASAPGGAGQEGFRLTRDGEALTLDYRIEDAQGQAHRLRFSIPAKTLEQARRRFRAYDPDELRRQADAEALRQVQAAADRLHGRYPQASFEVRSDLSIHWSLGAPAGYDGRQQALYDQRLAAEIAALGAEYPRATIELRDDGRLIIQAPDERQLRRIEQRLLAAQGAANQSLADAARQTQTDLERDGEAIRTQIELDLTALRHHLEAFSEGFFRERLYVLSDDHKVRPDYAQIARLAVGDLAPVAAALRRWTQGLGTREALGRLLLLIQSIPYDQMEQRGSDAGFRVPVLVLTDNRGDCDSKAVTFAALAHLLYPDLRIGMVLLPQHAYLALGLKPESGDQTLKLDRQTWTVAEAAGPGLLPIGRLAADSRTQGGAIDALVHLFP